MNRRNFLLAGTAISLVGCAGQTVAQWLSDGQTLIAGLQADLPALLSVVGIPASLVSEVQAVISQLSSLGSALAGATSASGAASIGQTLASLILPILSVAIPLVGAATPIGLGLTAASVLLPIFLQEIGVTLPTSLTVRAALPVPTMSVESARAVLVAHARQGHP